MNLNFKDHIPAHFNDDSKVWIYQSNRDFTIKEVIKIEELLEDFTSDWKSHGEPVTGFGNLFFGHFIILIADESASGVSGCSTDTSVRLIKNIEQDYNVKMFERQNLAFIVNERIQLMSLNDFPKAVEAKIINGNSLYFNNTVVTKKDLLSQWIIPAKDSWLADKFKLFK